MKNPLSVRNNIETPGERITAFFSELRRVRPADVPYLLREAWQAWRRYLVRAWWDDVLLAVGALAFFTSPLWMPPARAMAATVRGGRGRRRGEQFDRAAPCAGEAAEHGGVPAWRWDAQRGVYWRPQTVVITKRPGPTR